jgi:hypothetical protein
MAARMLRLHQGKPNPRATSKSLSRTERKQATRLWQWALDTDLHTSPQGRPPVVDGALVLYSSRTLAEACGQTGSEFSRPRTGRAPAGPMWRALIAALPLAESFLACLDGPSPPVPREIANHAGAIVDILKTARSKTFEACCRELNLGPNSGDVADHPATFRLALMVARAPRKVRRK